MVNYPFKNVMLHYHPEHNIRRSSAGFPHDNVGEILFFLPCIAVAVWRWQWMCVLVVSVWQKRGNNSVALFLPLWGRIFIFKVTPGVNNCIPKHSVLINKMTYLKIIFLWKNSLPALKWLEYAQFFHTRLIFPAGGLSKLYLFFIL